MRREALVGSDELGELVEHLPDSLELLSHLVRDFDVVSELSQALLERHDEFDAVKRVGVEVVDDVGLGDHIGFVGVELLLEDVLQELQATFGGLQVDAVGELDFGCQRVPLLCARSLAVAAGRTFAPFSCRNFKDLVLRTRGSQAFETLIKAQ